MKRHRVTEDKKRCLLRSRAGSGQAPSGRYTVRILPGNGDGIFNPAAKPTTNASPAGMSVATRI